MPRTVTVTFGDGSTHVYDNVPDDAAPEAVTQRATRDFRKTVTHLDGGRPAAQPAPAPAHKTSFMDVVRGTAQGASALGHGTTGAVQNAIGGVPFLPDIQALESTAVDPRMWTGKMNPVESFKANRQAIDTTVQDYAQRHPVIAAGAQAAGTGATMLVPGMEGSIITKAPAGATLGARALNTGGNMARGAVAGGTTGAVYGMGSGGSVEQRLEQGVHGMEAGAALGGALSGAAGRSPKPKTGKLARQAMVDALAKEDIRITPGQATGGVAKALEDAGTSFPIAGTAIQSARRTGFEDFNRAAVNRALRHVGDKLPDGAVGNEAVDYAQRAFGERYDALVPTGGVKLDPEFQQAMVSQAPDIQMMEQGNQKRLAEILSRTLGERAPTGAMGGEAFKHVQTQLRTNAERFSRSPDPDHQIIAQILLGTRDALQETAARQNPDFARDLSKLDLGYAGFKQVQRAAAKSTTDGVFTPAQYASAIRNGDRSLDKGRFAAGNALNQDFAKAAQQILPNQIPDSGTAGRGLAAALIGAPGAAIGGLVHGAQGAAEGYAASLAGLGAASAAYSPAAMDAYNAALRAGISSREANAALEALKALGQQDPKAMELYQLATQKLLRGAGAASADATSAQ